MTAIINMQAVDAMRKSEPFILGTNGNFRGELIETACVYCKLAGKLRGDSSIYRVMSYKTCIALVCLDCNHIWVNSTKYTQVTRRHSANVALAFYPTGIDLENCTLLSDVPRDTYNLLDTYPNGAVFQSLFSSPPLVVGMQLVCTLNPLRKTTLERQILDGYSTHLLKKAFMRLGYIWHEPGSTGLTSTWIVDDGYTSWGYKEHELHDENVVLLRTGELRLDSSW